MAMVVVVALAIASCSAAKLLDGPHARMAEAIIYLLLAAEGS
jgi:hypothetical protein